MRCPTSSTALDAQQLLQLFLSPHVLSAKLHIHSKTATITARKHRLLASVFMGTKCHLFNAGISGWRTPADYISECIADVLDFIIFV